MNWCKKITIKKYVMTTNITCKHFPVDKSNSFVQLQITMTQAEYNTILNRNDETVPVFSNKGKALI